MDKSEINVIIEKAKNLKVEISAMGKDDVNENFETLCKILNDLADIKDKMKHIQALIIESFTNYKMDTRYWGAELDTQKKNEIKLVEKLERIIN
ncbi:hypothetical protein [Clostridium tagluense]|uniref:Uncharacterized protein n=1 Tax=Clostridium tagluense TaxID=360422 RepID=A0A401USX5_9CLOT|nr:hypothetical protein [Clostridium tagluense]GCD12606.1 hypothetical protein Ctaglu_42290 [Clostridium tagluense]